MGIGCLLKLLFVVHTCVLKASKFSFDLLGQLVTMHLGMPKFIQGYVFIVYSNFVQLDLK